MSLLPVRGFQTLQPSLRIVSLFEPSDPVVVVLVSPVQSRSLPSGSFLTTSVTSVVLLPSVVSVTAVVVELPSGSVLTVTVSFSPSFSVIVTSSVPSGSRATELPSIVTCSYSVLVTVLPSSSVVVVVLSTRLPFVSTVVVTCVTEPSLLVTGAVVVELAVVVDRM